MEIRCGLVKPIEYGSAENRDQTSEANDNKMAAEFEIEIEQPYFQGADSATRCNISKQEEIVSKENEEEVIQEDVPEMRFTKSEHLENNSYQKTIDKKREIEQSSNKNETKRFTLQSLRESIRESLYGSSRSAETHSYQPPIGKIENHFIDVGSLTFGSIFGIGEKLEHRVIMARTTVQCLMIPRFWLFEKDQNPGNIWQRRRFYLDTTIPSRHTLFKDFLYTRQWQKFKTNLIQSHLSPNTIANPTRVQDVPIICRIVEAHDE